MHSRDKKKWKEADRLPKQSKEAFEAIKVAISSRPVMAYPNNNGRFHLYVDAALGNSKDEGGLGAALWQEDKHGIKQVIGYASRRLTASEKNYPAFVAEMQAAVYGMTYFQHYLVSRKFTLYTDHKPLCKLSSTHVKTLNRLQLKMTELSPEIRYIEGKNNTVADFLSRYHGLGAEDKKTEVREYSSKHQGLGVAQVDASAPRIRALQLLDNNLEPMIRHKPNAKACRVVEDQLKPTNMKRQILHVRNGIVYITNQTRQGFIDDPDDYAFKEGMPCLTTHKILTPEGFRKEIITKAHNSKFAGHGGRFKTQERLRQDFLWTHMDKTSRNTSTNANHAKQQRIKENHRTGPSQDYQSHWDRHKGSTQTSSDHYKIQKEETCIF
jgi:ribonuclease HI